MNKLTIALLAAGSVAAIGFIASKIKNKKNKNSEDEFFDEYDYDDECDACVCDGELDIVTPDTDTEECAEEPVSTEEAACETAEAAEDVEKKED